MQQLYDIGGRSFWIHNTGPLGCMPIAVVKIKDKGLLDEHGCYKNQNDIPIEFNKQLKDRVIRLREELPGAALIYVDMYAAKHRLIVNAKNQGTRDYHHYYLEHFVV